MSGHTEPLGGRSILDVARGAIKFGLADAVCLAGTTAGSEIGVTEIQQARDAAAGKTQVIIGTGVCLDNIERMLPLGDAFSVGTSLKKDGDTFNPIDPRRAEEFMRKFTGLRGRARP